jgi:hypothetical protein
MKILSSELRVGIELGKKSSFLLPVVEYFMEDDYYFLIMELCCNGDLERVFEKNKEQKMKMSRLVLLLIICFFVFVLFYIFY